ncbi:unnamed protein product, partial [Mesorhabditis belari]|uniref:Uncharacterized protein n=1 Tax=Mesorhabditis belari TaxID=2138241 RepID=A0AAF3EU96_9BILA
MHHPIHRVTRISIQPMKHSLRWMAARPSFHSLARMPLRSRSIRRVPMTLRWLNETANRRQIGKLIETQADRDAEEEEALVSPLAADDVLASSEQ